MKSLNEVIAYKNPAVVRRFSKEFPLYANSAEEIFEDLMRFFWASFKHAQDKKNNPSNEEFKFTYIMDEEMRSIDQMWHIFLLYTKDYMNFCQDYFGEYIHHLPDLVDKMDDNVSVFQNNLEKFLSYTYDLLGEATIRRWYAEYV
jgi:hypothetical protein